MNKPKYFLKSEKQVKSGFCDFMDCKQHLGFQLFNPETALESRWNPRLKVRSEWKM